MLSVLCMPEEIQQEQHGAKEQPQVREIEVEPGEWDQWETPQGDEEKIRHTAQEQALILKISRMIFLFYLYFPPHHNY